jgi:hypothetical protein
VKKGLKLFNTNVFLLSFSQCSNTRRVSNFSMCNYGHMASLMTVLQCKLEYTNDVLKQFLANLINKNHLQLLHRPVSG